MKIVNLTKNTVLAENAEIAKSIWQRGVGLLGKKNLAQTQGLILWPCDSVHTFFMRFSIDVIFVNSQNQIIALYKNLKPFRITAIYFKSKYVVELPAGIITATSTEIGDILQIQE